MFLETTGGQSIFKQSQAAAVALHTQREAVSEVTILGFVSTLEYPVSQPEQFTHCDTTLVQQLLQQS